MIKLALRDGDTAGSSGTLEFRKGAKLKRLAFAFDLNNASQNRASVSRLP